MKGESHATHDLAPDWTGCGFNDPDHSYEGGRIEVDNGVMDGFMKTSTADVSRSAITKNPTISFCRSSRAFHYLRQLLPVDPGAYLSQPDLSALRQDRSFG